MGKASEEVIRCLKEKGIRQTELAHRMGVDRRNLNEMLHRQKDLKYEKFVEMIECAGYTMELKSIDAHRVCEAVAKEIMVSKQPAGKFWYEADGRFISIVSDGNGNITSELYMTKQELMDAIS